jgi:hypothetical protein
MGLIPNISDFMPNSAAQCTQLKKRRTGWHSIGISADFCTEIHQPAYKPAAFEASVAGDEHAFAAIEAVEKIH